MTTPEDEQDQIDGTSVFTCYASCCKDATYVPVHMTDPGILMKTKKLQGTK